MTTIQLNFTIRTSPKCRSVHLVGSWDGYKSFLALSRDSSRDSGWKGTFRFAAPTLQPGGRYWYYYITDGTYASHDPARTAVVEPTTGRTLNVLDIPVANRAAQPSSSSRHTTAIKGRSLSPSRIVHPHPSRPYETRHFRSEKFSGREMEDLSRQYAAQRLSDDSDASSDSDSSSARSSPSFGSRSSNNSSPSSVSSLESPITPTSCSPVFPSRGYGTVPIGLGISMCSCERYAVLRDGSKMRVDCGGKVCGGSGSECSSGYSSEDDSEDDRVRQRHSTKSKTSKSSHKSSSRHSKSSSTSSSKSTKSHHASKSKSLFSRR